MAALPQLEAIVNACAPLLYTQSTCPGLHLGPNETATASTVLARFEEEVAAAEYVHGFEPNLAVNPIQYLFAPTIPFQLNLYTPCSLGIGLPSSNYVDCKVYHKGAAVGMDKMMQLFFGSRPFTKWPPPFLEANDRVVFTAINVRSHPRHTHAHTHHHHHHHCTLCDSPSHTHTHVHTYTPMPNMLHGQNIQ